MKILILSVCASALLFLGACQSTGGDKSTDMAGEQAVNALCPMMPSHEIDPEVTVEWSGKKIAFCCGGCIEKWDALTDEERQAKLTASMK